MFTVKVVETSSGRPVKGTKVSVGFAAYCADSPNMNTPTATVRSILTTTTARAPFTWTANGSMKEG